MKQGDFDVNRGVDAIALSVIAKGLLGAAEAMGEALVRSAFSPNIKQRRDCSTAIFDRAGRLAAQAEHIPLHLGSMLGVVEATLEKFPAASLREGDAFVANDPYLGGGTHLPDVTVVTPFFCGGEVAGFVANVAHHADIGAKAPGGIAGDAASIEEEGLRLGATRLEREGELNGEVFEMFARRVRMPEQSRLDLLGQLAANRVGLRLLGELFAKHGAERMEAAMEALLTATERRARRAIAGVPDGVYAAQDEMEGIAGEAAITISVQVEVEGERLCLDFAGSGAPSRGAINVPRNALLASVYYAVKASLDAEILSNAGLHRAIEVAVPEECILNARPPAAVGARTDTCQQVAGRIIEAFGKALARRLPAPANDASTAVVFAGVDPRRGREYVYVEAIAGGAGGGPQADGLDGVQVHITNTSNLPVEALEHAFPLRVGRYEFVPDSGGAGRFRGGMGLCREIRVVGHRARFAAHGDRHRRGARGAQGGLAGGCGGYFVGAGEAGERRLPPKISGVEVEAGEVVRIMTPGGGGYGEPRRRPREEVAQELADGIVGREAAREIYGWSGSGQDILKEEEDEAG